MFFTDFAASLTAFLTACSQLWSEFDITSITFNVAIIDIFLVIIMFNWLNINLQNQKRQNGKTLLNLPNKKS
jgi:hypothetical protein